MSTDRELLELAARAVGIVLASIASSADGYVTDDDFYWNPLLSDGDAFRIAADLSFDLNINPARIDVFSGELDDYISEQVIDGDVRSATRRAIVRAAAEIGRSIPC